MTLSGLIKSLDPTKDPIVVTSKDKHPLEGLVVRGYKLETEASHIEGATYSKLTLSIGEKEYAPNGFTVLNLLIEINKNHSNTVVFVDVAGEIANIVGMEDDKIIYSY